MPRTPLEWPAFQPACLKKIAFISVHISLTAIRLFGLIFYNVHFVLRLRQIWRMSFNIPGPVDESPRLEKNTLLPVEGTQKINEKAAGPDHSLCYHIFIAMLLLPLCAITILCHFRLVMAIHDDYHSQLQKKTSSGLKEVFQLYQPINFASDSTIGGCDVDTILMDHVFGSSYGKPFVGT